MKGAAIGIVIGRLFFRKPALRRCATTYGAGMGLGMSYAQVKALWSAFDGSDAKSDDAFYKEINSLETEIRLRYKLK
jgi:hypothetical protein